jgi:glucokinase
LGRVKLPTDTTSPEMTLESISQAVRAAVKASEVELARIKGIGLGIPGKVDPEKGIGLNSANLGWQNIPVKSWLEKTLALPCAVDNDVAAGALGESRYGAGQGLANMVYVSLGTGIAARVIIEGQLYRGTNGLAGEIGHAIFVPDGPACLCGGRGCLEAVASGGAIGRLAQAAVEAGRPSLINKLRLGSPKVTSEMVFEAALQGDSLSNEILVKAGAELAYALHLLALAFDPQAIVLGGGLSQTTGPYLEAIRSGVTHWATQAPIFQEINRSGFIRLTGLNRDAGILGAAAIFMTD